MNDDKKYMVGEYEIFDVINRNSERDILLCKKDENDYVIKSFKKIDGAVLREIDIMKKSIHPNIIRLEDIFLSNKKINIASKAYSSDCYKILLYKTLNISQRIIIVKKVADAIKFLHDNGIIHMDIKPSNVFVKDEEVVLADFSVSNFCKSKESVFIQNYNPLTYAYSAPENLASFGGRYSFETDIWSFSIFCLEILSDQFLIGNNKLDQKGILSIFREKTFLDKEENISFMCKNIDKRFRKKCINFLKYIIQYEKNNRPTIDEIIGNELFKGLHTNLGLISTQSSVISNPQIDLYNYLFIFQTTFLLLPHIKVECFFLALNVFEKVLSLYKEETYKFYHQVCYICIKIAFEVQGITDLSITEIDEDLYQEILIKMRGDYSDNYLYEKCVSLEDLIQTYSYIENGEYGKNIINVFGRDKNVTFDIFYVNYEVSKI